MGILFNTCRDKETKITESTDKVEVSKISVDCEEEDMGNVSDGYHTFNELYHHRAVLTAALCALLPYEQSWKSLQHDEGDMFDGMFIVGIETEHGQATYHYDIDPYFDGIFAGVREVERAPKWDGHTSQEAIERIERLASAIFNKKEKGEI